MAYFLRFAVGPKIQWKKEDSMQHSSQATAQFKRMAVLCAALLLVAGCNKNAQQSAGSAATAAPAPAPTAEPVPSARTIYPDPSVAKTEINESLQRAKARHKRVILDFGGNWCGDCQVLDIYFHDPANKALLEDNFELVDVNIGRYDANQDIAERYGIPLKRGVPALVVLSPEGKVLLAQTHGEFETMRNLQSSNLTKFLNDWKPTDGGSVRGGR
jgi:thiol:disulfide interchange protein